MSSKVHSQRNIPFSWENEPGVSKAVAAPHDRHRKLPLPPCPAENSRVSYHDLQIPLPPCAFQPPLRSSSKKGIKKNIDDPFLIAYKEVTKSTHNHKGKSSGAKKGDQRFGGVMKNVSIFSCKSSCGVADDNLVRLSQLPISRSFRDWENIYLHKLFYTIWFSVSGPEYFERPFNNLFTSRLYYIIFYYIISN